MIKDILTLTELYLHASGYLPDNTSWNDFHDTMVQQPTMEFLRLLVDREPKGNCKYAIPINLCIQNSEELARIENTRTINQTAGTIPQFITDINIGEFIEIGALTNWAEHLFWQGAGGRRSKNIRNTPNDFLPNKTKLSKLADILVPPLKHIQKTFENNLLDNNYSITINQLVSLLDTKAYDEELKKKSQGIPSNAGVFIFLKINNQPLGKFELFRHYTTQVRGRAGRIVETSGQCPFCQRNRKFLKMWWGPAELSFYQSEDKSKMDFHNRELSIFSVCQACADLLFIYKQHLLEQFSTCLGGYECLIVPGIKHLPSSAYERRRLYFDIKSLISRPEFRERLFQNRMVKLGLFSTVTYVFGEAITRGASNDVKRLNVMNLVFTDILPSRLSAIARNIRKTNEKLAGIYRYLRRKDEKSFLQNDFKILKQLLNPFWELPQKKNKSYRRSEIERYLHAIFYAEPVSIEKLIDDIYYNLQSVVKTSIHASNKMKSDLYKKDKYLNDLLILLVFFEQLGLLDNHRKETERMEQETFCFHAMPELGDFISNHPLLKEEQYRAPFLIGCLFAYVEYLQMKNARPAAYNWLGTMALSYEDIHHIYAKSLNYIIKKYKLVEQTRLQEIHKAIAHYDHGSCDNDRIALVAFCHGWGVGRDFLLKVNYPKKVKEILKSNDVSCTREIEEIITSFKDRIKPESEEFLKNLEARLQVEKRTVIIKQIKNMLSGSKQNQIDEEAEEDDE